MVTVALQSGQLVLQRGHFVVAEVSATGGRDVTLRPHGSAAAIRMTAARIIDCRGIRRDPRAERDAVIADLLANRQARVDPLRISLDVTCDCKVIARTAPLAPDLRHRPGFARGVLGNHRHP